MLLQLILLRRRFRAEDLLQIPISVAFGVFIDLTMELLWFVAPQHYAAAGPRASWAPYIRVYLR